MKFPFNLTLRAAALALALLLSPAGASAADGEVFAGTLEGKQITELLQKRGISAEQALKITSTLSQVADTGSFAPSDKYKLTLDKKGRFSSLVLESSGKTYSVRSEDGSLTAAAPRQETETTALPKASAPAQEEKKPSWRTTSDGGKIFTGALEGRPLAALLMEKGADRESAEKSVAALEISGVSTASFGREAGFVLELGQDGSFRRVSVMDAGRLHTVIRDGNDFSARVSRPFSKPAPAQEQQAKPALAPAEAQQAKPAPAKKTAFREYAGTLKDERLADLLERKGVPAAEAARIATAMSAKTGTTQFGAEDRYKLAVSDRGELSQLALRRADGITYTVAPDNGAYKMTRSGAELKLKMDKPKPAPAPEAALVEIPQTPQSGLKPETLPVAPPASETLALSWGKTAAAPAQAAPQKPEQKEISSAQEKPAPKAEEKTKDKKKADRQTAAKGGEKRPQAEKPVEAPAPVQTAPAQTVAEPMPAVAAAVIAAPPAETAKTEEEEKPAYISGTIGADSVYIVLKKHGFKEPVLTDATLKLGRIINQKKIWDKDEYRLQTGPNGEFVRFAVKHFKSVYSVEKTASGYAVAQASGWPAPRAPKESAKPAETPATATPKQETPAVVKAEEKPAKAEEKAAPKSEEKVAPKPEAKIAEKTEPKPAAKAEVKAVVKAEPKAVAAPKAEVKAEAKAPVEAQAKAEPAARQEVKEAPAAVLPQPSVLAPAAATTAAPVNAMTQQVGTSSPYMILKKLGGYKEPLLSEVIDRMGAMLNQKKVWDEDICRLSLDEKGAFASFELSHAGTVYTVRKNSDGKFESGKEKGGLKSTAAAPAPAVEQTAPAKTETKPVAAPQKPEPAIKAEEPKQPEPRKPEAAPKTETKKPVAVKTERSPGNKA